ncbi:MAG: Hpt domain-containing protein [Endozoicomonas sp. (ex Botrylloides leachii)]|nr:Hpt domain-containing protein [Endozoicomonas sp. (ex Botrylloides leachii)]
MLDLEYLEKIAGHDKILLDSLLDQFLQTTKQDLIELQTAVEEKNISTIKALVHRIKGAAVTVGAGELESILAAIETSPDNSSEFYQTHLEKACQSFDSLSQEMKKL